MNSLTRSIIAIICVMIISLCVTLSFSRISGRARLADLTEYKLYSLSDGTRRILGKISQPLTLELYFSRTAARKGPEQIRFWNNYFLYVRDLLDEYVALSGKRIRLSVIDPRPYSDEEEEAISYGLQRFQLSESESFFFGLVAKTELGREKVLKFFEPNRQEFVEYDVTKIISELLEPEKKTIGVISSLPVTGSSMSPYLMQMMRMQGQSPEKAWNFVEHFQQSYDLKKAEVTKGEIEKGIDFLLLVHPKNISGEELFAVDQFVMRGGKLIVFQDPFCMVDAPAQQQNPYAAMEHDSSSSLNSLLIKWGVMMDSREIAVDRSLASVVQLSRSQPPVRFPPYLKINESCVSRTEPAVSELHNLQMLYAGSLKKVSGTSSEVRELITTTAKGSVWKPGSPFEMRMPDPSKFALLPEGNEKLLLACIVSGNFESNFPDGYDLQEEKEEEEQDVTETSITPEKKPETVHLESIRKTDGKNSVIVVADVDFISNELCYQETFFGVAQVGDNPSFVLNSLDYLGGSEDLISVRSKGRYQKPFIVMEQISAEAEKATSEQIELLNRTISGYQEQLRKLGESADSKDLKLLNSQAMSERAKLESEIRKANKELRKLQAKKREKVEKLEFRLEMMNMVGTPAIILLFALIISYIRWKNTRNSTARRV